MEKTDLEQKPNLKKKQNKTSFLSAALVERLKHLSI